MKILFISSGNTSQGISPIIARQAQSIQAKGIDLHIFTIKGKGLKGYYNAIFELKTLLKQNTYHVFHAHYGLCAYVALFGGGNAKKVVSFMGDDILGEHNHHGKLKPLSVFMAYINKLIVRLFFDAIIVKSKEMQNKVGYYKKLYLIPNGVNTKVFYPEKQVDARKALQIEKDSKLVLFVANPERPEKNFKLAKDALSHLEKNNFTLKVVQNANENELRNYYNAADVVLMTSFHEGSPNVIKEAMACNCPIVSTAVGDVSEVISQTEGCYVVDYKAKKIADAIQKACLFRKEKGFTNGLKSIINKGLGAEHAADKIINVYQSILN